MIYLDKNILPGLLKDKKNLVLFILSLISFLNAWTFIFRHSVWNKLFNVSEKSAQSWDRFFIIYLALFIIILFLAALLGKNQILKTAKIIFWTIAPAQLTLAYGIGKIICNKASSQFCYHINHFIPLSVVLFFILAAILIIYRESEKKDAPLKKNDLFGSWKKFSWKKNYLEIIMLTVVAISNLGFGIYHIADYAAVDEPLWTYDRIPKFWNNLKDWEWYKTNISDKPGITLALVSGTGLNFVNPQDYEPSRHKGQMYQTGQNIEKMNFFMRLPVFLFCSLILSVFYFLVKKLLGKTQALIAIAFIGLSPILLGISRIINPDSLLWIFTSLAVLSYFIYTKYSENQYLYWSGVFLGFSLLTKYIANIFFIFFLIAIFWDYIFRNDEYKESGLEVYLKKSLKDYLILVFFSLITFLTFLPAAWIDISLLARATILSQAFIKVKFLFLGIVGFVFLDVYFLKARILSPLINNLVKVKTIVFKIIIAIFIISLIATFLNTYLGMKWYDFESITASPKSAYKASGPGAMYLSDFYSLAFGITPLALLLLIYFLARNFFLKKISFEESFFAHLLLFILLYYTASTLNRVSADVRYQIIIYPLVFIIASMAFRELTNLALIKKSRFLNSTIGGFLMVFLLSLYSLNFIKPFYFSYASELLPKKYVLNLKDMGDGSFEAAQFLNSLPDASSLNIWTDKKGVCVFFIGQCNIERDPDNAEIFDYLVLSSGREKRTSGLFTSRAANGKKYSLRLDQLYLEENPLYKLEIGGRPNNFVKIVSVKNSDHEIYEN